ncbi:isochorismatase family protein [candidate division WOR-3 bacterium]|nr:isochorismatase family protein [candidate division WOR-3 bacterium]
MKKQYFTEENIKPKAKEMFEKVKKYREYHDIEFLPGKSALLVIDMQKYFIETASHAYVPSAEAILPGVKKLISVYSGKNLPVIFTLHSNNEENAGMMKRWWPKLIGEGTVESHLPEELELYDGIRIEKHQYDAFYDTNLEEILNKKNISQLVICGVMTNICCETTARSAFVRGFEVFFCVDGTATYSEEHHMATLTNLSYGFAIPVLLEELFSTLSRK